MVYYNPFNWIVFHPLQTINNQGFAIFKDLTRSHQSDEEKTTGKTHPPRYRSFSLCLDELTDGNPAIHPPWN